MCNFGKYMKTDYSTKFFSDECKTILVGLDGLTRGCVLYGNSQPTEKCFGQ